MVPGHVDVSPVSVETASPSGPLQPGSFNSWECMWPHTCPLSEAPNGLGPGSHMAGHPSRHHRAAMECSGGSRKHLTHHIRLRPRGRSRPGVAESGAIRTSQGHRLPSG